MPPDARPYADSIAVTVPRTAATERAASCVSSIMTNVLPATGCGESTAAPHTNVTSAPQLHRLRLIVRVGKASDVPPAERGVLDGRARRCGGAPRQRINDSGKVADRRPFPAGHSRAMPRESPWRPPGHLASHQAFRTLLAQKGSERVAQGLDE